MKPFSRLTLVATVLAFNLVACGKDTLVVIHTSYGDIKVKLYEETPLHSKNFVKLVEEGFYDSLIFHRVINGFMIQGGSPDSKNLPANAPVGVGDAGGTELIANEFDSTIVHKRGTLCAARSDHPELATSACQFYIVQAGTVNDAQLDAVESRYGGELPESHREIYRTVGGTPHLYLLKFTAFGEVVEGMDVVDKIAAVYVNPANGHRPIVDVRMTMEIVKE
jgi:peptidyl-prolyl cis-trans isomerase B (cyclophilin B)